MEETTSREKVLKKIREALISKTDAPYPKIDVEKPVYREMEEPDDITFAQELTAVGGNFIYCADEAEFIENLGLLVREKKLSDVFAFDPQVKGYLEAAKVPYQADRERITDAKTAITLCETLVARLGSVMVSSAQLSGRRLAAYPEVHLVVAYASQMVPDLKEALAKFRKKYESRMPSMITLITGPSRTADIEKTLVIGAHGPRELYVFFIDDRSQL